MLSKTWLTPLIAVFFVCTVAQAQQLWTGILTPNRAIDWTGAGATIPTNWAQCATSQCDTVSSGTTVTAASINAAIASAPANTYVQLPAGSFTISGMIDFASKSNVYINGAGSNSTFITFGSFSGSCVFAGRICAQSVHTGDGGDQNYDNAANLVASSLTVDSTSITVSAPFVKGSINNIQVGSLIFIDQLDDASVPANGVFVCQASFCSGGGSGNGRNWRPSTQEEPQIVTSISGSGPWTIGISPGIRMPNYTSAKTPQLWSDTGQPITNVGIQNISLDSRSNGDFATFQMLNCVNCWVKGVRFIGPSTNGAGTYQVWAYQSRNVTVRDSYFYGSSATSNNYALSNWASADDLFENNVTQHVAFGNMQEGCIGCVQGYNFAIDDYYTNGDAQWQQASSYHHGSGDAFVLFEGNEGIGATGDDVHGTSNLFTVFRNYFNGRDPNGGSSGGKTEQTVPILLYTYNRFWNIVGNVLGTAGYHSTYQCTAATIGQASCSNSGQIYSVGFQDTDVPANHNDPYTVSSILRWGNYDTVTAAVRFCGDVTNTGWLTTCGGKSEIPLSLTDGLANAIPTVGDTLAGQPGLPPSFYYSSKPSWWGTTPWPANGPDVSGGNIANVGGHANHIPAANCYLSVMNGPMNGSATLMAFDASACYSSSSATGPAAPTNLNAVVQ